LLLADVLNRILLKQLLIPVGGEHQGDDSLVENVVDEGEHFVHREFHFGGRRDKFDHEVEGLGAYKVCLFLEHELQVRLTEGLRVSALKVGTPSFFIVL